METKGNKGLSRRNYLRNLARTSTNGTAIAVSDLTEEDLNVLLHEFGTYQIELETQNEELREAQIQLERVRDRYRSLYEFAPIGYFILNREGEVREANLTGSELLCEPRSRLLGRTFAAVLAEEAVHDFYLHIRSVIAMQEPAFIELRLAPVDGRRCEVIRLESMPVQGEDGEWLCRTAVSDITPLKRAEQALREANVELELRVEERTAELEAANENLRREVAERHQAEKAARKANEAKSRFLANMSHEIRTPMTVTLGNLQLLEQSQLDSHQREQVEMAQSSSKMLLRLLDEILDFSRVEAGKLTLEKETFSLHDCLKNVMDIQSPAAKRKNLPLELECSKDLPDRVIGDEVRIKQVLLNLVGNAVKFTKRGQIILCAEPEPETGRIRFSVRDTGIGIPANQIDRLFKPFSQIDPSTTRQFGGTGLGLALSKRLVEIMGGEIAVDSDAGQGATFKFTLSLPPGREEKPENSESEGSRGDSDYVGEKVRILLAEDEEMLQSLMRTLLGHKGWDVFCVGTGEEAIERWEREPFDMILMDVQMPGMDGFECTKSIREREKKERHTPIIGLTAHAREEDRLACLAAGMDDRLTKPLDLNKLYAKIEDTLQNRPSKLQ